MNPPNNKNGAEADEFEVHGLVAAYLDERLTDEQWEYLNGRMDDPEFWGEWQDLLKTEHALLVGFEFEGKGETPLVVPFPVDDGVGALRKWLPRVAIGIAAVVSLLFVINQAMNPDEAGVGGNEQMAKAVEDAPKVFAFSLANCRWETESGRLYPGDELIGREISLMSGVIKINFSSGRTVILSGKVDAGFSSRGENGTLLDLRQGELAVIGGDHESSKGDEFYVQTPRGLLEEIGTEFVVQVGGEGEVSVTVESGKVGVQGDEEFTLEARQSAYLSHNGVTREDRSFNSMERKLFDRMPETRAGSANVIPYDEETMGSEIYRIISPDSLLLVKERQNVFLKNGIRYNIDRPGTYPFYREGEEFRPPGWKRPEGERRSIGESVDSYLIQFNPSVEQLEDIQVYGYIDFDRPVQGILSAGYKLGYWDEVFGLPGVTYWSSTWRFPDLVRGLESTSLSGGVANIADVLTLSEDRKRLTIRLCASLRLDQIRVLLKAADEER